MLSPVDTPADRAAAAVCVTSLGGGPATMGVVSSEVAPLISPLYQQQQHHHPHLNPTTPGHPLSSVSYPNTHYVAHFAPDTSVSYVPDTSISYVSSSLSFSPPPPLPPPPVSQPPSHSVATHPHHLQQQSQQHPLNNPLSQNQFPLNPQLHLLPPVSSSQQQQSLVSPLQRLEMNDQHHHHPRVHQQTNI